MNKNPQNETGVFELKNLFRILFIRKWWMLSAIILVFIAGIIFSFVRTPQYMVQSSFRISNTYLYYNDRIYKFFPDESENLWIFPSSDAYNHEVRAFYEIESLIKSDTFLRELGSRLDNRYSINFLKDIVDLELLPKERRIEVTIVYSDGTEALSIMDSLSILINDFKSSELETIRQNLINKTNIMISDLEEEAEGLNESLDIIAEKELEAIFDDIVILKGIKKMLEEKELLVNRIEFIELPGENDIHQLTSLKRDLMLSAITALIVGIIMAFIANFFIDLKRNK